jgi:hypothetical protein
MKPGSICLGPLPVAGPNGSIGHPDTAMAKGPAITVGQCSPPSRAEQNKMADFRGGLNLKPETTRQMQSQLQDLFRLSFTNR